MRYVLFLLLLASAAPAQPTGPKLVETTERVYWYNDGPDAPRLGLTRRQYFAYDDAGRLVRQTLTGADSSREGVIQVNTFTYGTGPQPLERVTENPIGSLLTRLDYGYRRTTFTYTPFDSVASENVEQFDALRGRMRPWWRVTHGYDNRQRQTAQTTVYLDTSGRAIGQARQVWRFDDATRRVGTSLTFCEYRNNNRDTICHETFRSTFHYDAIWRLLSEVRWDLLRTERDSATIVTYRYDGSSSRLQEELMTNYPEVEAPAVQWRRRYQYDSEGRLVENVYEYPRGNQFLLGLRTTYRYSASADVQTLASPIRVSPNPCQNTVSIWLGTDAGFTDEVAFYNVQGQLVKVVRLGDWNPVSVADLPNGMYLLHIKGLRGSSVTRLFVQK